MTPQKSKFPNDSLVPQTTFPEQSQQVSGVIDLMDPSPDQGEDSWRGTGHLNGNVAPITGGDSGIGRAVDIAYTREGADVAIAYLSESQDASDTARLVTEAGRRCLKLEGDIAEPEFCREMMNSVVETNGWLEYPAEQRGTPDEL